MTYTMTAASILSTLPSKLFLTAFPSDVDAATPSSQDLVILVSTIAVLWSATFCLLHKYLHPYAMRQQWLKDAMGREYDRSVHFIPFCVFRFPCLGRCCLNNSLALNN
jgi:hypothetical protein